MKEEGGGREGGEEEWGNVVRLWVARTHLLLGERRGKRGGGERR